LKNTKNNFLGFRLPENLIEKLDSISEQKAKSRGLIAKNAIEQWINHEMFNQTNQMMIIPKALLCEIFKNYNSEDDFQLLIKGTVDLIADIMKFVLSEPMNQANLDDYIKYSIYLFGSNGFNWFNSIDINSNEKSFTLIALHDLNENFSIFFKSFYKYLLKEHFNYEFVINLEETTSNLIHLDFTLKK